MILYKLSVDNELVYFRKSSVFKLCVGIIPLNMIYTDFQKSSETLLV